MKKNSPLAPVPDIETLILTAREQRVILAPDLAEIYGVPTKALNQAVKRNMERFPADFMFRLTLEEAKAARRSRSQIVTLKQASKIPFRTGSKESLSNHAPERDQPSPLINTSVQRGDGGPPEARTVSAVWQLTLPR